MAGASVTIRREEARLKKQARNLMRRQLRNNLRKNRYFLVLVAACTTSSALLVFFLKERVAVGVSGWFLFFTAFLWLGVIVFGGTALLNYAEGLRMTKRSVEDYLDHIPQSRLRFDAERVEYITGNKTLTYAWREFTTYFETGGSIYLVPSHQLLQAFYFSKEDIGAEAYEELLRLARTHIR